jgi:hypothetical protein
MLLLSLGKSFAGYHLVLEVGAGISRQTIHNSTVDTELTFNVRNLVAKIRKSKIIELL